MKSEDLEFLKNLLDRACELPEQDREAFLKKECRDKPHLLNEALLLIKFDRTGTQSISLGDKALLTGMVGRHIGPYHLQQLLGEGGMGTVYLAAQSKPLRRQVAFKVIKVGMDTREVISRFESERQALALMDHPNIAKVFDAGATEEGRPFFVMEYIQGVPLTQYCKDHHLGLNKRLELFIKVCKGVEHAHQKGIIHRDLKPTNILVSDIEGQPVPKIIDFGVAKATGVHLGDRTMFTLFNQMIGTPEYMSPEQADPTLQDVDTRSDVYSLGVLLYELLTGVLPLDRKEILRAGGERMALLVRQEIPRKPSTRIDTEAKLAKSLGGQPEGKTQLWTKRVRGDLDWITMKALEKDRERRYGSASDLALDLMRHQEKRAVSAGPPSGTYRLGKFIRRNRAGVAIAAALLAALIGFAGWQTYQSDVISRERDKAQANEHLANARGLLDKDPTLAVAHTLASLEILDQPAARQAIRKALVRGPLRDNLPRWGQGGNPLSIVASPDGKFCAVNWSQSQHPTVGIYELSDYSARILSAPQEDIVSEVFFNSTASHVIGQGISGIYAWRVVDGEFLWSISDFANDSCCLYPRDDPQKMVIAHNEPGRNTTWYELSLQDGSMQELGQSHGRQDGKDSHYPDINLEATTLVDYRGQELFLQKFEEMARGEWTLVGRHGADISAVVLDATCTTAVSIDLDGQIKVWDLKTSPPRLLREYAEDPGTWALNIDPLGDRFLTAWGSERINIYDLNPAPPRSPVALMSSIWWAHDGAFLPDQSILTSHNGSATPVAHWKTRSPLAWTLDTQDISGPVPLPHIARDGRLLHLWTTAGELRSVPLVEGRVQGAGVRGKTTGWMRGVWVSSLVDPDHDRCLTYCVFGGHQILDLDSGIARGIAALKGTHLPSNLSDNGRWYGCLDLDHQENFMVLDVDSLTIKCRVNLGHPEYKSLMVRDDLSLLALDDHHLRRLDLSRPELPPDTLWTGDATGGGEILDQGRSFYVQDQHFHLSWIDLESFQVVELGSATPSTVGCVDVHTGLGLLAVKGYWENILVFDLATRRKWELPSASEESDWVTNMEFDPLGRWLLAWYPDKIVAWTLPLDPLLGDPEYEVLMASVRGLTNVRVVPDDTEPTGFRVTNTIEN